MNKGPLLLFVEEVWLKQGTVSDQGKGGQGSGACCHCCPWQQQPEGVCAPAQFCGAGLPWENSAAFPPECFINLPAFSCLHLNFLPLWIALFSSVSQDKLRTQTTALGLCLGTQSMEIPTSRPCLRWQGLNKYRWLWNSEIKGQMGRAVSTENKGKLRHVCIYQYINTRM